MNLINILFIVDHVDMHAIKSSYIDDISHLKIELPLNPLD